MVAFVENNEEEKKNEPLSFLQIKIMLLCSFVVFIDGYDIQALGISIPFLKEYFNVSAVAFAAASSLFGIGMGLGAILLAPFADKFGRRAMLIAMMIVVGVSCIGTMSAQNVESITIWRVITGLGIGASMPIAIVLASEFVSRIRLVTLMFCSAPIGAFVAGMSAPFLTQKWGWHGIFGLGAALPLVAALAFFIFLPPKNTYQLNPKVTDEADKVIAKKSILETISALFVPEYRIRTIFIWLVFAGNGFVNFSVISWLPTLLVESGLSASNAGRYASMIGLIGILGSQFIAWQIDKGRPIWGLGLAYIITAIAFSMFVILPSSPNIWFLLLVVVGLGAFGGHFTIGAFTSRLYPREVRSTGVGVATGMGRFGSIFGPAILAGLMAMKLSPVMVLSVLAVPMIICAVSVIVLSNDAKKREI